MSRTLKQQNPSRDNGSPLIAVAVVLCVFGARSVNFGGLFNLVNAIVLSVLLIFIICRMVANRQHSSL
jgi:hypothetical protein